jgi:hypothetical protein
VSESQFAYSKLTLDELRSLAASPQVGTLHAMPQSFRALADRVGEVADLLTHTQVNMHSWWKGPAAEQAAEALGQAAAEAREFHGSALAAASAVGRCAQVVEAQQHQMMNIPEVAEPGVTDVVRRPTTAFEALEAARQDNAYQAARQEAVQVVNGIAAQYVETRDQLGLLTTARGENFAVSATAPSRAPNVEGPSSHANYTNHWIGESHDRQMRHFPLNRHTGTPATPASRSSLAPDRNKTRQEESWVSSPSPHETKSFDPSETEAPRWSIRSSATEAEKTAPDKERESADFLASYGRTNSTDPQPHWESRYQSAMERTGNSRADKDFSRFNARNGKNANRASFNGSPYTREDDRHTPIDGMAPSTAPQSEYHPSVESDLAGSQMIPPYSGIGHVPRTRETRGKCPDYLKEQRSAWLPKTIAAPPDGVLSPEWFQQHLPPAQS